MLLKCRSNGVFSFLERFNFSILGFKVASFVNWISPSPVEDEIRGLIVTKISQIISATFADARVFPFGSYQTKLYLPMGYVFLSLLVSCTNLGS
jgi:DNA polymerase sigma